jgi:dethiobiotin synthetase
MGGLIFVTGNDTGAGKTVVSTALVAALRARGVNARGLKPIESGCTEVDGARVGEDSARHAAVSGVPGLETCYRRYLPPLAPSAAARLTGEPEVTVEELVPWIRAHQAQVEWLVVEGVGGLMVPLNDHETVLDWMKALKPDRVVLVVGNRLGVISQTLTGAFVFEKSGLPLSAVALNAGPGVDLAEQSNLDELRPRVSPVVPFPAVPHFTPEALAEAAFPLAAVLLVESIQSAQ